MKNKLKTSVLKSAAFGLCLALGATFSSFDSYAESLDPSGTIISKIQKEIEYPELAKQKKVEGTVWVQFLVDENGKIENIKALTKLGHGLESEVVEAVKELEDSDQLKSGNYRVPVKFDIR